MTIEAPGIAHWRAIYLVEGLITMVVAGVAFFLLKDDPEHARFLTQEDKAKLAYLHELDRPNENKDFSWSEVRAALRDPLTWVNGFQAVGVGLPIFSFAVFMPSIVRAMGYSNATAQLMTVPVRIRMFSPHRRLMTSLAVCVLGCWHYADRLPYRQARSTRAIPPIRGGIWHCRLRYPARDASQWGSVFWRFPDYLRCLREHFRLSRARNAHWLLEQAGNAITAQWYGNNMRGHSRRATGQGFSVAFGNLVSRSTYVTASRPNSSVRRLSAAPIYTPPSTRPATDQDTRLPWDVSLWPFRLRPSSGGG